MEKPLDSSHHGDITRPPDLHEPHGTGPVRRQEPVYVNSIPPCNHACPAGENIQGWLDLAQAGNFREAWELLVRDNPMPAVHGRVCYHPCESMCNRSEVDQAVSIHAVERFLGDLATAEDWKVTPEVAPTGKKVLIVGAGPSGLSAGWHLSLLGHTVEIREAGPMAGGMLRFGIPAYRMPRDVLDAEIARIEAAGVTLRLNHTVDDVLAAKAEGNFDAVFMAIGAHLAKRVDIPAREAGRILDALGYLKAVEAGEAPRLGRRVAIYGGGNTAMDAARTARRLGAEEAMIIYRRDRAHMPAHDFEADEAEAEGIRINWLRTIRHIEETEFTVEEMQIDEHGRPQPTGRLETLQADSLLLALGQNVDTTVLESIPGVMMEDGVVQVGDNMMTGAEGVFAGGDMVPSERTVAIATGHGKKAARHIDAWLRGEIFDQERRTPRVHFDDLNLGYFAAAQQRLQTSLPVEARVKDFAEITAGLDQAEARFEAARCYSCGNCFECDGCYGACPEQAIRKLGPGEGYVIDYGLCTGCEACVSQCPCNAMAMVAVNAQDASRGDAP